MTGINKDIVAMRDEVLGHVHLELSTGKVFDAKGNTIQQWTPTDNENTLLLRDYANDLVLGNIHNVLETFDRPRAAAFRADMAGEQFVKMDLGPSDVYVPSALPTFASGYRNDAPMADIAAPPMLVDKPGAKYYQFAKEDAFQRALPTIGAMAGGQPAEIAPRLANATFTTTEYAVAGFVSTQTAAAADAALRIRQATAKRILNALLIEREIRVTALLLAAASYDSSIVATLGAGFQWDGGSSSDPITDLQTRLEKSWGAGTAIIMSEKLWHAFLRNPNVQKYFTYKDGIPGLPDVDKVRQQFGLPPIYVAKMKYINSTGALDYIWGNNALIIRQPDQMPPTTQDDVATAYTFRWNGVDVADGTNQGGMIVREFFVQDRGTMGGNKIVMVHHDAEVVTSKFVGGLLVNAYQ